MEFVGTVYICPYCRVQRTVILLLGVAMILPFTHHWIVRFIASVVGFLGAVVAVNQNFMGWVKISKGTFAFNEASTLTLFSSQVAPCSLLSANCGSYLAKTNLARAERRLPLFPPSTLPLNHSTNRHWQVNKASSW